jgi:proton-dependent oligopeptide transporter, POT family
MLQHHTEGTFAALIVSIIIIALGTGGIKANVSPLVAEQYTGTRQTIKVLKSGERVIVDPNATIQRIYLYFYMLVSPPSLGVLAPLSI